LKFIGKTPEGCSDGLLNKKWDKYRDADVPIEVPADFYDGVKADLASRVESVKEQISAAEKSGNLKTLEQKQAELERIEKTSKNLKKSVLTKEEAIEARLRPKWSTAKDIAKLSHGAGLEAAQNSAMIGGGMALIRNTVSVFKCEKEPTEAILDTFLETGQTAGFGYATGFTGAAIKGAMQNASSSYVRALSKTNLPGTVIAMAIETSKTLQRYALGKIDGTDCLIELGDKGAGMITASGSAAWGATVGTMVFPGVGTVVGGFIGGMLGHAMASAYYNGLVDELKGAKLAHEERLRIEAECEQAKIAIREYRFEMELVIRQYFDEHKQIFEEAFDEIMRAYNTNDVDVFISGANKIPIQLGRAPIFSTKCEFEERLKNPAPIKL
jgi:hypothetical protein